MSPIQNLLGVMAMGALGSGARYAVGTWVLRSVPSGLPWATFAVNAVGCFFMGLLAPWSWGTRLPPGTRTLLMTGFLGGFTTWSAFSLEVVTLARDGRPLSAVAYGGGTVAACLGGCALAAWMGR